MDIYISNFNNQIENKELGKILFIYNAINDGWNVEKQFTKENKEKYIFRKKHENKREIFSNKYLEKFISDNLNIK